MPCPLIAPLPTQSAMTSATSAGVTRRPIGWRFDSAARASSADRPVRALMAATVSSVIGVSTYPGQTALTVTPLRATSTAADRTRPSTPCLLAAYAPTCASPRLATTDATTTTRPHPAVVIAGRARRTHRNGI